MVVHELIKDSQTIASQPGLRRTTLVREVYRALVNTGRSYAAFTDRDRQIAHLLKDRGEILDPMSGYGLLTRFCAEIGVSSYCVEMNLPQYLWQVLCEPASNRGFLAAIAWLLEHPEIWPQSERMACVSNDWLPDESRELLLPLFRLMREAVAHAPEISANEEEAAAALLLPFSGRLSCSVPGDNSTHTKMGGMCVYEGWADDFRVYLEVLSRRIEAIMTSSLCTEHSLFLGDARTHELPEGRFGGMLTSPPYPNFRDFAPMFEAEHEVLRLLRSEGEIGTAQLDTHLIGSRFVAGRSARYPHSTAALRFLDRVGSLKRTADAAYDDDKYYIPYFAHYFADLEDAYRNISRSLAPTFDGYIIVVNNTHRNLVIPVSDVIMEIWSGLGYTACVHGTAEMFHIGTKNPRARGLRARHTEYAIKVSRQ